MWTNFDPTKKQMVKNEDLLAIAEEYRRLLALINTPVYKAAPERVRFMFEGQVAGMRETMKRLLGMKWEEVSQYAGIKGKNFFDLQKEAQAKLPGESFTDFSWEK